MSQKSCNICFAIFAQHLGYVCVCVFLFATFGNCRSSMVIVIFKWDTVIMWSNTIWINGVWFIEVLDIFSDF